METTMNNYQPPQRSFGQDEYGWPGVRPRTAADSPLTERMSFIRKVYGLFFLGILTSIGGVALSLFTGMYRFVLDHYIISFGIVFVAVFAVSAVRLVKGVNILALLAFTALIGVWSSPLILYALGRNPTSLLTAGGLTTLAFGGLTAYVFITRKDFSFLGGFLWTGFFVLFGAALLGMLLGSSVVSLAVSSVAIFLFSGFVLYDTSNIIHRLPTNEYVAGALDLFLDFFNIFISLLRILNRD
jgi:FtsH-binding integral membrane protein